MLTWYRTRTPFGHGICAAGVLVVLIGPIGVDAAPPAELEQKFRMEAPLAWEEYKERAIQQSVTLSFLTRHSIGTAEEATVELKGNETCRLVLSRTTTTQRETTSYSETAWVSNSRYVFELRKRSANSSWLLVSATLLNEQMAEGTLHVLRTNEKNWCPLVWVDQQFLGDLIAKPYFRIVNCELSGEDLVRIEFSSEHEIDEDLIQGGYLLLDPTHYWCLRGYNIYAKSKGGESTWKFEVIDFKSHEGMPASYAYSFERLINIRGQGYTFNGSGTTRFEFGEHPPPESDFTLAAFGLPETFELQQQAKSKPNYWLWTALVGGACILIGVAARWWVRRWVA